MEEIFFYCQACDKKITLDQLALLNEGKCPSCGSQTGFSSLPKSEQNEFENLTMVNDADLLKTAIDEA